MPLERNISGATLAGNDLFVSMSPKKAAESI